MSILERVKTIFNDSFSPPRSRKSVLYLRSRARQWRLQAMQPNDRPPSDCLALAELFDAKADAVAERSAEFAALDRTLNLLGALAGNADSAARDRTDRLGCALARMGDLLQELDNLDLHVAAAYLSMALDTARGTAPRLNG